MEESKINDELNEMIDEYHDQVVDEFKSDFQEIKEQLSLILKNQKHIMNMHQDNKKAYQSADNPQAFLEANPLLLKTDFDQSDYKGPIIELKFSKN
jgi:hypothetical protein